ncbi:MAG TPA: GNAT family N-acetyltransferase, partial [Bryobacteraceae bacterium]|nr:GNAT family N-acetyltransferase [Bryobacteraceae bacterium]
MPITVRRFAPDEWRAYRELRLRALVESPESFGSTHAREVSRSDQEWEARLREGVKAEAQLPLVALSDDVPVGLAWGRQDANDASVAHLFQVWVAPEARARGIGRLLLDAVIGWAKTRSVRAIRLGVTPSHPAALRLYRRAG